MQVVNTGMPIITDGISSVGMRRRKTVSQFAEKFTLHLGVLTVEPKYVFGVTTGTTISASMCKEFFRVECCQGQDARFVFTPG